MANDNEKIQSAQQLIQLARAEETADGNPLTAARHYITAMEIVGSVAGEHASRMNNVDQRRLFLFQIRTRLEVYYERAALLLQVATETGLLDKPAASGGLQAALPNAGLPPPLFDNNSASGKGGPGAAVMGIPMNNNGGDNGRSGAEPDVGYYLRPDDASTMSKPPGPLVDLDALMRDLRDSK